MSGERVSHPLQPELPSWVVFYNIVSPATPFLGTGWEFFRSESAATSRFREIPETAREDYVGPVCATLRPYHHAHDANRVAACHRLSAPDARGDDSEAAERAGFSSALRHIALQLTFAARAGDDVEARAWNAALAHIGVAVTLAHRTNEEKNTDKKGT